MESSTIYLIIGIVAIVAGVLVLVIYRRRRAQTPSVSENASEADPEPAETDPKPGQAVRPAVSELSSLPEEAKKKLLGAIWYLCENPDCKHSSFLDVHQIVSEIEGGTNGLDNLIVLCSACHAAAHNGEIPPKQLKSWIRNRQDRFKYDLDWPYR